MLKKTQKINIPYLCAETVTSGFSVLKGEKTWVYSEPEKSREIVGKASVAWPVISLLQSLRVHCALLLTGKANVTDHTILLAKEMLKL